MLIRLRWARRYFPRLLGAVTLADVGVLFAWDGFPNRFPAHAHDFLAAFSLAAIALAYLAFQIQRRAAGWEFGKSILLAAAFLFWAANQLWPKLRAAVLFNDIAIALFVLDLFLVIAGWPPAEGVPTGAGAAFETRFGKDSEACACCSFAGAPACCRRGAAR